MKAVLTSLCFLLVSSIAFAANWPTGEWQAKLPFDMANIEILAVDDSGAQITITWDADARPALANSTWAFDDESKTTLKLSTGDYVYAIKRTTFGDLILSTQVEGQTKNAFLKPVLSPITSIEQYPTEQAINDLPDQQVWRDYAGIDLWKYWGTDSALDYPTFRCNNGNAMDPANLCYELRAGWLISGLEYDYTRMLSRQIYTYGVIYNMTGNEDAYEAMQIGLEALADRVEPNGSVKAILHEGEALHDYRRRTSQDLAYAQIGFAMAYYITGEQTWLNHLDAIKNHIMDNYYNDDWGMLAWTLDDQMPGDSKNLELVAQLDQLNAYLLFVYPHLPAELKPEWEKDIRLMVDALLNKFHDKDRHRFAGVIVDGEFNDPRDRHNDFGHSVKTYWMIYTAGKMLNDANYIQTGAWGIDQIARKALRFREMPRGESHWGNQEDSDNSSWWEFAELTQATATLALEYNDYARALPDIYRMWLENFVDKNNGGVWMSERGGAKQHLWKNGYHESEMGLIALITSQALKGEPVSLYFKRDNGHLQPYLFAMDVESIEANEGGTLVTFK